ncbi:NTP transferase domain-containing protein [Loktanella agnita]|uniref:nucleotidyltransferase family protein n=1 Tax=Loktanella agnita TaxID=287097 RepID=UPI00398634B4
MIPILILAAGSSSRMRGKDKLLEKLNNQPVLRRQAQRAIATGAQVFIALPDADHPRAAVITDLDVTPLITPDATEGMSGTMRNAIAQLPPCPAFMILLADLVALDTADLRTVLHAHDTHPDHLIWRGTTEDGQPGHPIIFDSSLRPAFAKLTGDSGGAAIVKAQPAQTRLVRLPGQRALLDLDTPEDWADWRASIAFNEIPET